MWDPLLDTIGTDELSSIYEEMGFSPKPGDPFVFEHRDDDIMFFHHPDASGRVSCRHVLQDMLTAGELNRVNGTRYAIQFIRLLYQGRSLPPPI